MAFLNLICTYLLFVELLKYSKILKTKKLLKFKQSIVGLCENKNQMFKKK